MIPDDLIDYTTIASIGGATAGAIGVYIGMVSAAIALFYVHYVVGGGIISMLAWAAGAWAGTVIVSFLIGFVVMFLLALQ